MDTYSMLRQFADSWALLLLFLFFIGVIFYAWRPGSSGLHADAGKVPFRHDDRPSVDPCGKGCPGCTCQPENTR